MIRKALVSSTRATMSRRSAAYKYMLSVILAAVAGWTDAVAYIYGHGTYVSFMSGNSTQLSVASLSHDWAKVTLVGAVLGSFILGVVSGELLARTTRSNSRPWVLLAEALLLAVAAISVWLGLAKMVTLLLLSFALGTQNASVHHVEGISVALTYVTGTLVRFARGLTEALLGEGSWQIPAAYLGLWLGLICGALIGTAVTHDNVAVGIGAVSLVALALSGATARTERRAAT
jgi:uncharacterized membrane protein YoaK (UPF0700 family)